VSVTVRQCRVLCTCSATLFAINLLHAGVDIFTVSQLLGHSNVKITQRHYLNFIPGYVERKSEATRKLDYGGKLKVA
jgi:integrase